MIIFGIRIGPELVIGAVALVLTFIGIRQHKRKALYYEFVSCTSLVSVKDIVQDDIQILYKGEEVKNVDLLEVRIINSGNASIEEIDFHRSLALVVNDEAKILTATIKNRAPSDLDISVEITDESKKATLSKTLLNPGDEIIINLLVTKYSKINLEGRISGVNNFKGLAPGLGLSAIMLFFATLFSIIGLVVELFGLLSGKKLGWFALAPYVAWGIAILGMMSTKESRRIAYKMLKS